MTKWKDEFLDEPTKKEWKEIEEWINNRHKVGCCGTGWYWKGPGYIEPYELCTGCKDCKGHRKEATRRAKKTIADLEKTRSIRK